MKKAVKTALAITTAVVIILAVAAIVQNELEMKYIAERDGEIQIVDYSILNVRQEPGEQSEIITTIERGDNVKLTGKYKTMSIGGRDSDTWAEVSIKVDSEGNVVTGEDIEVKDGDQFTLYFGWVTTDGIRKP